MKKALLALLAVCAVVAGLSVNLLFKVDFVTLDGESKQWRDLHGQWVVVNYFAQWCAPCLREIPELNEFYRENKQIAMFAVSFDTLNQQQLLALREQHNIEFPILAEISATPWQQMPKTLPHTLIIDPQGKIVRELKGEQSAASLLRVITKLQGS
ncbi:TlpA family protein disulfide reductase [Paraglaciecola hydrolytica]|uniref:Redoxin n=1 Tax=Paraglaciecola hydrolytica TaxID=1799789 RepID=A0A136A112_9ALTE|nr:TlpA disulfide reductase family protein [Paraglaciecola hydrolytica]KXI28921.1 redoxin [Paraglaciecola hydrolytica]